MKVAFGLFAFAPAVRKLIVEPELTAKSMNPNGKTTVNSEDLVPPPPPPPDWDPNAIIENFAKGELIEITDDYFIIDSPIRGEIMLTISDSTTIWKGGYGRYPIELGDTVSGWGTPVGKTNINIDKAWVNIVSRIGFAHNVKSIPTGYEFILHDSRTGARITILTDSETDFVDSDIMMPQLVEGQVAHVIGIRLNNGVILATKLFTAEQNEQAQPSVESYTTQSSADFYGGHMVWYDDCNGSNGKCGDCNNNSYHVAFQKVNPGCNYACLPALPTLNCNDSVWIRCECNLESEYGAVKDCSTASPHGCNHSAWCNGQIVSGYTTPIIEVTEALFIRLVGSTADGRAPCQIWA